MLNKKLVSVYNFRAILLLLSLYLINHSLISISSLLPITMSLYFLGAKANNNVYVSLIP